MEKLFKDRALALSEILKFDIERYGDVNWVTILEAIKLAGIRVPKFKYEDQNGE
jgi:hypothetical protein